MAGYSTSNPPFVITLGNIDNSVAPKFWGYSSGDAAATVAGASYFSNGIALGMKVNDLVFVVDTATPLVTCHRVKTLTTATGAVTVSSGTTVGAT